MIVDCPTCIMIKLDLRICVCYEHHRRRLVQDPVHTGTLGLLKGRIEEDPDRNLKNTVANNPQNSVSHLQMRINSDIFTCVSQLPKTHPDSIFPQCKNDALSQ
jgi:hypothetical protein